MEENNIPVSQNIDMDINADAEIPGSNHLTNPETVIIEENEQLNIAMQEQKDKYLRLVAEFDNYKRRTAKERMELIQTAGKEIIVSLLEVIDDIDRAEKQMEKSTDINQVKEGNKLVFGKLKNILQSKGLSSMQAISETFDVEKHEAITEIEAAADMKGKVVEELEKGYYLNDKLIRFAKVVVGK